MHTDQPTEFGGVAGRVLQGTISGGSLISGMVLGFALIVGNVLLFLAGAGKLAPIFTQILVALALARFAVNGRFGEWSGSVFSTAGGSWADVGQVTLRYLALTCLWLIPMMLIEAIGTDAATAGTMNPTMDPMANPMMLLATGMVRAMLVFLAFYFLASTLTPPLILVISVGSDGFGDIFSPQQWKEMFGGRLGDLFSIYVVYTGALVMVFLLCIPLALLSFAASAKLGFVVVGLCTCMVLGVSLNLLGRLCGFFACGDVSVGQLASHARPEPRPAADPSSTPVVSHRPSKAAAAPTPIPVATASPSVATPAPPAPPQAPVAAMPPAQPQDPSATQAIPAEVAQQALAGLEDRKPVLTDAKRRADLAFAQFATDPAGAIAALEQLDRDFATHPMIQQALPICLLRAGQVDRAVAVAKSAVPFCMERGPNPLAAEIVKELRAHIDRSGPRLPRPTPPCSRSTRTRRARSRACCRCPRAS
jgi:hypothetical protein